MADTEMRAERDPRVGPSAPEGAKAKEAAPEQLPPAGARPDPSPEELDLAFASAEELIHHAVGRAHGSEKELAEANEKLEYFVERLRVAEERLRKTEVALSEARGLVQGAEERGRRAEERRDLLERQAREAESRVQEVGIRAQEAEGRARDAEERLAAIRAQLRETEQHARQAAGAIAQAQGVVRKNEERFRMELARLLARTKAAEARGPAVEIPQPQEDRPDAPTVGGRSPFAELHEPPDEQDLLLRRLRHWARRAE